jgi:exosortase A
MTIASHWKQPLAMFAAAWALILVVFIQDAMHLVSVWLNSSTFAHCIFLPPIIGWLVWLRRGELAKLTPRPWMPGLIWVAGGAFIWFIGDAASVSLARHLGLILMLQGAVPAMLGPQVAWGLAFPIFYAFFMLPFGEELVPPMQMLTADMSMALLRLTGIPAYIEGIFITTPGGYFAVAEACSGVKFLVAMAALSVLAAHLLFKSWQRRAAFLVFAMVVPVLANGVRAYGTIWMAEQWGTEFAVGADHLIYGWIFFGLVIAIVGWAASPWFDRNPEDVSVDAARLATILPKSGARMVLVAPLLAMAVAAPVAAGVIGSATAAPLGVPSAPAVPGWTQDSAVSTDWRARFDGSDARLDARYSDAAGNSIDVVVAGYARQSEGAEPVGYGQGAVDPESDWAWGERLPPIGAARVDRIAKDGEFRDVLTLFRVGDTVTASPGRVKIAVLRARLTGGDERTHALIVSAQGPQARATIGRFVAAAGGAEALMAAAARSSQVTTPGSS